MRRSKNENTSAANKSVVEAAISKRARQISREIASIHAHLQTIRDFWARALGVTGPQWVILTALQELDRGEGVPVNAVSNRLLVDSSFVTTQSNLLEKNGFVRRKMSQEDARVVLMSLTNKTYRGMSALVERQSELEAFIFEEFADQGLDEFLLTIMALKLRLRKAAAKAASGL